MDQQFLRNFKSHYVGKFPQKYRCYNLNLKQNQELKTQLQQAGFFDFHSSNNGQLVGEHQIVAFFHAGGLHALRRGLKCIQGEHEVHHLDGNGLNNNPGNLQYLPVCIHQEITISQRRACRYLKVWGVQSIKRFSLKLKGVFIWNRQGRLVMGLKDFIASVLERTLIRTAEKFGHKIIYNQIQNWRRKVRKALEVGMPTYWQIATWLKLTSSS